MIDRLLKVIAFLWAVVTLPRRLRRRSIEKTKVREERRPLRRWLSEIGILFAILVVGGFFVAASGIIPIKASSGHWAITEWFLNFSMERSVKTHSFGREAPPLDDPALALKGAGHYETGCRPCHGSPELPHPRITSEMTPRPPYLPEEVAKWDAGELFYIVKHGVKFTGMPAWPAQQRDDEVWAMVAFLRELPEMDTSEYRRLARGERAQDSSEDPRTAEATPLQGLLPSEGVPPAVTQNCASCHGRDGQGRGTGAFPRLAGQRPTYLYLALQAFARGERHSGIMEPIATGLSTDEMQALARYYGGLEKALPDTTAQPESAPAIERGRAIANRGVPNQRVPSCADCHGPGSMQRNPAYPDLAGQYADYLVLQLELFQQEHRGGSAYARIMDPVVHRLTPEQMREVALFYESLKE